MILKLRFPLSALPVALALLCISAASPANDVSDLQSARENLEAARGALARAAAELTTLVDNGGLTEIEKEDFLTFIGRLKQVVEENCRNVLTIKAALQDDTPEQGCDDVGTPLPQVSFPDEATEDERVAALEQQLKSSMSEFDELLLREMEELERQRSTPSSDSASAGGGNGSGRQSGTAGANGEATAAGSEPTQGNGQQGSSGGDQNDQQQTASSNTKAGQQQSVNNGGQSNEQTGAVVKQDAPPADSDDDIVARQLREAAENETDPEMREKLWAEYRRYKADTAAAKNN